MVFLVCACQFVPLFPAHVYDSDDMELLELLERAVDAHPICVRQLLDKSAHRQRLPGLFEYIKYRQTWLGNS